MATYLDLATLSTDPNFLARIGYAIGNFAAYILNEDPAAANHAARLNWALKANLDTRAMAVSLAMAVCRSPNVTANLAAVVDTDLQPAVETAANQLIGQPVSYSDLMALAANPLFLQRIQVAVAHFAMYILNEAPNVANHAARYAWAKTTILNTTFIVQSLAPAVVVSDVVVADLMGISDAALQAAVETVAQQLLL
jgi:hypothetical protein